MLLVDLLHYSHKLTYREKVVKELNSSQNNTRRRRRNVIWFNPPYSGNVKTNIGKIFFGIIKKHFPEVSELSRLFNKKSLKISYSCMPNMKSLNKKVLRGAEDGDKIERGVS